MAKTKAAESDRDAEIAALQQEVQRLSSVLTERDAEIAALADERQRQHEAIRTMHDLVANRAANTDSRRAVMAKHVKQYGADA